MTTTYLPDHIFTGSEWLSGYTVTVTNNRIAAVQPVQQSRAASIQRIGGILAPAFIDLQVYGAYGKLFSAFPEPGSLELLMRYCREGGAALCQPTVATNTRDVVWRCIDAVRQYWKLGGKGILGLHLEGPWINADKRGAHIADLVRMPDADEVKEWLDYGRGVIRTITLAPECCDPAIIQLIRTSGILISAGHSNASYAQAVNAFGEGVSAVTHLYNAMSALQHREPGLAGAAMDDANVMASIIPDGIHASYAAVRIAKKVMRDRLFVITDAVTETATGPYPHQLNHDHYVASGVLSGSALDMAQALRNLIQHCHIDAGEALRMCSLYPAKVAGIDGEWGRIEKGYRDQMVLLDHNMNVLQMTGVQ